MPALVAGEGFCAHGRPLGYSIFSLIASIGDPRY